MRTEEVTQKYHITRQSINNWERFDGLKTKRTGTNRLIWDDESIGWLEQFMRNKVYDRGKKSGESIETFQIQNRRYLGAKSRLLDFIKEVVTKHTDHVESIADIFAGTGVVANAFFGNV